MADIITLKQLFAEVKLDLGEARERLRAAARDPKKHPELAKTHKPRAPWSWLKGSAGEKEARQAPRSLYRCLPLALRIETYRPYRTGLHFVSSAGDLYT